MILVVDDTPANIDILLEVLGELDEIAVALDGEEALEILEDEIPDAVLLDIVMPGMDGFEVCRKMKEDDRFKDIPVFFLSGNDSQAEREKGLSLGALDYFVKPIDPELIIGKIKPLL